MRDELLSYYERELTFLRQMGAEFAEQYPKIASRLLLEPTRCEDPHVERLIESVALLAARVHLRLDDDFPEISQALLNIVCPHYTRPIPSMSVAEFQLRSGKLTTSAKVPRGSLLYSRPVEGLPCKFRTCQDTEVWPIRASAQWTAIDRIDPPIKAPGAVAALRIRLDCWQEVKFAALPLQTLRFYINAEPAIAYPLYELLCNNCRGIVIRDPNPKFRQRPVQLVPDALIPAGFDDRDAMLPYSSRSFSAYRLLQEYFAFAERFLFFDLRGADALRAGGFQESAEILILVGPFDRAERHQALESGVGARTLRLGCSPIVNLFNQTAEPIQLDDTRHEYPVVADYRHSRNMEIFSIEEVVWSSERTGESAVFEPFFSFRHGSSLKQPRFWNATRRQPAVDRGGVTDVFLSLVDLSGRPLTLDLDTLTVRCICSNGDLPSRLPFGEEAGDFDLDGGSPVARIVALRKPTATIRPAIGRDALWRLISHLSLNYLSLVEGGREALQEILRLYQGTSPHLEKQIDGILAVRSDRRFARVVGDHGISYVRGVRVELDLDEERFVGGGAFLFSSVLEQFLAQYVSLNSFSQLAVRTRQRKEVMREWAPRSGNRILL